MEPGVLDEHPGGHGKGLDQGLVLTGELGRADLVCEVEAPVNLIPHLDGNSEERLHRWVVVREPRALRMLLEASEP